MSRGPGSEAARDESIAWRGWARFRAGDVVGAREDLLLALDRLSVWWPAEATTLQTVRAALSVCEEDSSLLGRDEVPFFDAEWGPVLQPAQAARNPGMGYPGTPWVEESHQLFAFLSDLWEQAFGVDHPLVAWPLALEGDAKTRFPGFDAARTDAVGQLDRAIRLIEAHMGHDAVALLQPLEILARFRADRRLGAQGIAWARRWVVIAQGVELDPAGVELLVVLSGSVASWDYEHGRQQAAIELTESVWRRVAKAPGEASGDLSEMLAHMHQHRGDLDRAILFMSFAARRLGPRQQERKKILKRWEWNAGTRSRDSLQGVFGPRAGL